MESIHNSPDNSDCAAIEFINAGVKRGKQFIWTNGNVRIPRGSLTAIVGTNGTGKTTMMHVELGLLPLTEGSVKIFGQDPKQLSARIGYVPQNYTDEVDSHLTAKESVLLGITGTKLGFHITTQEEKKRALQALEYTGIAELAHRRLSTLSGGQRQRVAIAQALVNDPQLLLLDEPLANLDLASQHSIVKLLTRLNQELKVTIQVVAHDLNMLLPVLTGAIYLIDTHPHYAPMNEVLDADLLTHLYGTRVQVVTTPQGDMYVTPSNNDVALDTHSSDELATWHHHHHADQ